MSCTISDVYGYRDLTGALVGVGSQTVLAVPQTPNQFISDAGTWRPGNGVNPLIVGNPTFRYGELTQTDGTGAWSLVLPYAATETFPADPPPRWTLVFPDGSLLTGSVPSVAGPIKVRDLVVTYGWAWASQVYVAPVTQGSYAKGTAVFTGGGTDVAIVFATQFVDSSYIVTHSPGLDTNNGSIPQVGHSNKATAGFTLSVSDPSFVGQVDWEAKL